MLSSLPSPFLTDAGGAGPRAAGSIVIPAQHDAQLRLDAPVPDHVAAGRQPVAPLLVTRAVFQQAVAQAPLSGEVSRVVVVERWEEGTVRRLPTGPDGKAAAGAEAVLRLAQEPAQPALAPASLGVRHAQRSLRVGGGK